MKKYLLFTILVLSLVLSGCSLTGNNETKKDDQKSGLANPASVFCEEQGGELELRDGVNGQYGVCKFDDGSECEEWAFYRLECKKGDSNEVKSDTSASSAQENGKKDSNQVDESIKTGNDSITVFGIESGDNITSPVTIRGEGVAFENNLIVELRNSDHETLVQENTTIKSTEVGEKGPFEITLNFEFNNTKEGYIAVYEQSAKDGSEQNLVEIPVRFNSAEIDLSKCEEGIIADGCMIDEYIEKCEESEIEVDDYTCKCIDMESCPECPANVECEICLTGWECVK